MSLIYWVVVAALACTAISTRRMANKAAREARERDTDRR